jgi:hypothetical protein
LADQNVIIDHENFHRRTPCPSSLKDSLRACTMLAGGRALFADLIPKE